MTGEKGGEGIQTRTPGTQRASCVVTHTAEAPQRTPKFTDSAWGSLRAPTGWSLRDLAERTGINPGELSRIERGRSCPTPDQARRILAAYQGPTPDRRPCRHSDPAEDGRCMYCGVRLA